jgi:hypothetical protein
MRSTALLPSRIQSYPSYIALDYALCYALLHIDDLKAIRLSEITSLQPIVVYLIEQHPLDMPETGPLFRWLKIDNDFKRELEGLIGPFDENDLTVLVDKHPAGPAWKQLLNGLLAEKIQMVITHLAPLSSAQRQQLIGVCAQTGAQLITPGDAGRNRLGEEGTRII